MTSVVCVICMCIQQHYHIKKKKINDLSVCNRDSCPFPHSLGDEEGIQPIGWVRIPPFESSKNKCWALKYSG